MTPKNIKPTYDPFEQMADLMGVDIVDKDAFTDCVVKALMNMVAPRLYMNKLIEEGIISPKKAPSDARAAREVSHE